MKRVLHVIAQYPGKTGSGVYLKSIMQQCSAKGYDQALIAGVSKEDSLEFKYADEFYPVVFNSPSIPFPILGMSDNMPYKSMKYSSISEEMMKKWEIKFKEVTKNAIGEFKPDVIISHHLWLSTSFIADLADGIKTIGICHGTDLRQLSKSPIYKDRVISGCQKLDKVFALNVEQKKKISDIYIIPKDNIVVVGGGYNEKLFYFPEKKKYSDNNREIKIIYAGKLSFSKGLMSLLKVFDSIKTKYNTKLYLAGTGSGEEERSIKEYGREIGNKVIFLGNLKQSQLGDRFRASDLFVLPSFYEGLPLVVIESLASGLRIVTTDIPGLKSYLGETISNSDSIEYVGLPQMLDIDQPLESDLPIFEDELQLKIEKQILKVLDAKCLDSNIEKEIELLSWKGVFSRMEKHL
nr:glycosyltransferase family 4 protein [Tissierella sp.]